MASMTMIALAMLGLTAGGDDAVSCVSHRSEAFARGAGYNHLVHLESACNETVRCHVSSDVNPEGVDATLAPGAKETVTLFQGSPASGFKATVTCKAARRGGG
ncbi:MAG: hypothetical protein H6744_14720 [Deltaproteobacteria bacterium]|nr:hypothetical protein [Deltaproteobacteria bacterium]MCB9787935.1 hypothetical protein [Deltaproteobacteria bacterium]